MPKREGSFMASPMSPFSFSLPDMKAIWPESFPASMSSQSCPVMVSVRVGVAALPAVTLHVPLNEATRGLVGAPELKRMKRSAVLINTSRGGVVDEAALAQALRDGVIAGAGVDVYETEPPPADHPLRSLPNCVCTPHLAASTEEAQTRAAGDIARAFVTFFSSR